MELRRSVREKARKNFALSDDEDEVIVKKTKTTSGVSRKTAQLSLESFGIGKRNKKKNSMLKNYELGNDSDSDFDVGVVLPSDTKTRKKKGVAKPKEFTKVEFLLDWKREMLLSDIPTNEASYKVLKTKSILETDLSDYATNIQALFINVQWRTSFIQDGVKIEDLRKLDLNRKLMKNGIIFVWSEKEILGQLIKIMEIKGFFYIENFVIALLDVNRAGVNPKHVEHENKFGFTSAKSSPTQLTLNHNKSTPSNISDEGSTSESTKQANNSEDNNGVHEFFLHNLKKYPSLEADQLLMEGESDYLKISKRVLMMFRRTDPKESLELRHQRTSDALFDLIDSSKSQRAGDLRTKEYVYKLIETLLPKASYAPGNSSMKMVELFADPSRPREGWLSVCQEAKE